MNDLRDFHEDRIHKHKKKRPIASGKVSKRNALILFTIFCTAGLIGLLYIGTEVFLLGFTYLLLNICYSFGLKKIPILDLIILISGYLIRLQIGAFIGSIPLSLWIIATISIIALYLILFKRYSDVLFFKPDRRTNVYRKLSLKIVLKALSFLIMLVYSAYIFLEFVPTHENYYSIITIPLVIAALTYFHRKMHKNPHQDPLNLLIKNPFFIAICSLWIAIIILVLYF